jgi:hypothetical protein
MVMRQRWGRVLDNDPCGNPNLSLQWTHVGLAFPPRTGKFRPWRHAVTGDAGRFDRVDPEEVAD